MKRFAIAALLVLMLLGLVTEAALAAPPAGSTATCTASFEAMTLEEILELAELVGVPEANARRMFDSVNKNEDAWICAKKMPSPDPTHYNFVDNQAVGLERG
jgi:hypothetical protein